MSTLEPDLVPVPILSDNYAWIVPTGTDGTVAVVDPGDAGPVLRWLEERGLGLTAIILTHHHGDHVAGVPRLAEAHQLRVFGPAGESITGVTDPVGDGSSVELDGLDLEVLEVPGHTAGHVAFAGPGFVLTGDALFAGGCGRVFEGTFEQMHASLGRLAQLPPATRVHCAHEYTVANLVFASQVEPENRPLAERLQHARSLRDQGLPTLPSVIAEELQTNPFLRCDQPEVVAAASRHAGRPVSAGAETFAVLRKWKDSWRG